MKEKMRERPLTFLVFYIENEWKKAKEGRQCCLFPDAKAAYSASRRFHNRPPGILYGRVPATLKQEAQQLHIKFNRRETNISFRLTKMLLVTLVFNIKGDILKMYYCYGDIQSGFAGRCGGSIR